MKMTACFYPKLEVSLRCRCWVDIKDAGKVTEYIRQAQQKLQLGQTDMFKRKSFNVTVVAKNERREVVVVWLTEEDKHVYSLLLPGSDCCKRKVKVIRSICKDSLLMSAINKNWIHVSDYNAHNSILTWGKCCSCCLGGGNATLHNCNNVSLVCLSKRTVWWRILVDIAVGVK